jgi:3alpha(or 20beta)-hydroxysteroid dehydrogenase
MDGTQFRRDFAGRSIVVTGGARGQGAAEVELLAREGAHVFIGDVRDDRGRKLADRLRAEGLNADFVKLDVTSRDSWIALAEAVRAADATLWGLINNAGVAVPGRIETVDEGAFEVSMNVNALGALLGIQTLAPLMTSGGSIINVGSVAATIAHTNVVYGAAKWALRGISKSAAVDLARHGIRVNMIHPGYISTEINANGDPRFFETHVSLTPQGRAGTVDEIARVARFLLSDDSSYVTGVEIPVDGGFTAHGGSKPVFDAVGPAIGA